MEEKDVVIVNAVSSVLELRTENPGLLSEEILRILLNNNKFTFKKNNSEILFVSSADNALKLKAENPKLSKKEIIQIVLDKIKKS